jgi:hypothetical protein
MRRKVGHLGCLLAAFLSLFLSVSVRAQEKSGPAICKIGTEIESVFDLDAVQNTFGSTMWLWAICPSGSSALETTDFPTATQDLVISPLISTRLEDGQIYEYRRIHGHFRKAWDLRHYPFDTHVLEIPFEEWEHEADDLVFEPDLDASFLGPDVNNGQDDWVVSNLLIVTGVRSYDSTFGYASPGSQTRFARGAVSFEVARRQEMTFVKFTLGMFVASVMSLICFFLDSRNPGAYTSQLGILTGVLFAILFNLRSAEAALGYRPQLTLVTELHLVAIALVLVVAVIVVRDRRRAEEGIELAYPHWPAFYTTLAVYTFITMGLITRSAILG